MLTARRWTRYGHDRVYVSLEDGTRVGVTDLKTGKTTIELPEWTSEFHEAVGPFLQRSMEAWLQLVQAGSHQSTPQVGVANSRDDNSFSDEPSGTSVVPPTELDLALNVPGQGARQVADEHLSKMRERSRIRTLLSRALDAKTEERAWRVGASGEESVGARLESLKDKGWHVLHSIPVGERGSDIDHLHIGSGGVFTINTKNHPWKSIWVSPNQIRVNGQPVPYLGNSRFEAKRVGELLSARVGLPIHARAALVILTGTLSPQITIKGGGPEDVWILSRWDLLKRFTKAKPILGSREIDELFAAARHPSTWTKTL